MGFPAKDKSGQNGERARLESFFTNDTISTNDSEAPSPLKSSVPKSPVPPRPSREMRRMTSSGDVVSVRSCRCRLLFYAYRSLTFNYAAG